MPVRQTVDTRCLESAKDSAERFLNCLSADIKWWRENASAIPDQAMKTTVFEIAAALEDIKDQWRARWHL